MEQVTDFFQNLLDPSGFPTRWHNGNWTSFHGWLHVISEASIGLAYVTILLTFVRQATQRNLTLSHKRNYLFAAFAIACAFTHFIDVILFWNPIYRFSALIKLVTAILSWSAVIYLVKAMPSLFTLKQSKEFQNETDQRKKAEEQLIEKNRQLAQVEKMGRLSYAEWDLLGGKFSLSEEGYALYNIVKGRELLLSDFFEVVHPHDRERVKSVINRIVETKTFESFVHRVITATGKVKYLKISGDVQIDNKGSVIKIAGIIQDITEQQHNVQKIEDLDRILKEIASIHSHNVRGPLATILGLVDIFKENDLSDSDKEIIIEGIKVASNNLDSIITEIVKKSWALELMAAQEAINSENDKLTVVIKH